MGVKKPLIILDSRVVSYDCDDTLVMWHESGEDLKPGEGKIKIDDPYYKTGRPSMYTQTKSYYLTPHKKHIHKLKGYSNSGWFVIIWSNGGGAWARNVAYALGIESYANLIIGKPSILFDDEPFNEAFRDRKYYQPKGWKK